jgi:hypothetical protein
MVINKETEDEKIDSPQSSSFTDFVGRNRKAQSKGLVVLRIGPW